MSKIIMCLHLPEPKIRKRAVKAVQKHKDKTKYTRKYKHKATEIGGLSFIQNTRDRHIDTMAKALAESCMGCMNSSLSISPGWVNFFSVAQLIQHLPFDHPLT